jgi:glycerol-3-phosphate dehydrogenase (NAD(P)+)
MPRLGVIGAGAWGTALAIAAARAGTEAVLWGRSLARLAGAQLPAGVRATAAAADLHDVDAALLAVPAQQVRAVLPVAPPVPLVLCAKGLEKATGLRLSQVAHAVRPGLAVAALSGPSFAAELAAGKPTAVTLAAAELGLARHLAEMLAGPGFRLYPSDDLVGVELGGALKNVVAIAAGAVMGLGLGENARAAVVTRGLAEIARLAEALGARRGTLLGLSGVGDLLLTATSLTSRNTRLGHELARGRSLAELTAVGQPLAEGAWTAGAACRLGHAHGIELPIAGAVRQVVDGELSVAAAVDALLRRPPPAWEFPPAT